MSRNDYDDMGQSFSKRRRGEDRKTYVISFMGILIILIAVIIYIILKPVDGDDAASAGENTSQIELDIPTVEEVDVERSLNVEDTEPTIEQPQDIVRKTESVISFIKPSDGVVTHSFNELYNGSPLDGITYSDDAGSAVYAVADGIVSDAGYDNEFGRYITITHSQSNFKSYYYSLETVNVKPGDKIKGGYIIGSIGTSNRSFDKPTLYFKLEKGSVMQDPA